MTQPPPTGARRTAPLRLIATAHAVSTYGSFLNLVALGLFALHITGSALQTGLFMAVRLAAGFVMGPLAGHLASRYPARPLMIGSDLLSAGTLALLVALPPAAQPRMLYALAVVLGAGQTLWGVALRSSLPALVGPDRRARANAQIVTARSVAMLLGFASAGVLVAQVGYHVAFLIDAASFTVSALLLLAVPAASPSSGGPRSTTDAGAGGPGPRRLGVLRGVTPVVLAMIAVRSADALGSASHNVGLPVYATLAQPDSPAMFAAAFTTAWAAGSLLAGRWFAHRSRRGTPPGSERAFGVATCLMSVAFILAFTSPPVWALIVVTLVAGAADGYAEISYTTRLQAVDDSRRAHLFGFASAAQNGGFGLGMVGCAVLLDRIEPLPVVAAAHGLALLAALAFLLARRYLRSDPHPQPTARPVEVTQ